MKTIIAGSRSIWDYKHVKEACEKCGWEIKEVISGTANGVDKLGERWAAEHKIPVKLFPARWDDITAPNAIIRTRRDGSKYNVKAGLDRNCDMAVYGEGLVAVWDGESTGTLHMVDQMRGLGKRVFVLTVSPDSMDIDALLDG